MFDKKKVDEILDNLGIKRIILFDDGRKLDEHSLTEISNRINELQEAGELPEWYEWSYIPKPQNYK